MAKVAIIPQLETSDRVRQVAVPPDARALCALARTDYEDAFLVGVGGATSLTAEQWARAALEDAPVNLRQMLMAGWSAIGLELGCALPDQSVLGWKIRNSAMDFVLLTSDSRAAMAGELLFKRRQHALLFCTFVQQNDQNARDLWARIEAQHVRIVRHVLERAAARALERPPGP